MSKIKELAKKLCSGSTCHHLCKDTDNCIVEDEAEAIYSELIPTLKQALWEIVRDENIIITNQNIDWLLDRAYKLLINENKSNNFDVKSNNEIEEKYLTPSEVRKMTPKEVKENYDLIIQSMKRW